jgi:hypothetical protein
MPLTLGCFLTSRLRDRLGLDPEDAPAPRPAPRDLSVPYNVWLADKWVRIRIVCEGRRRFIAVDKQRRARIAAFITAFIGEDLTIEAVIGQTLRDFLPFLIVFKTNYWEDKEPALSCVIDLEGTISRLTAIEKNVLVFRMRTGLAFASKVGKHVDDTFDPNEQFGPFASYSRPRPYNGNTDDNEAFNDTSFDGTDDRHPPARCSRWWWPRAPPTPRSLWHALTDTDDQYSDTDDQYSDDRYDDVYPDQDQWFVCSEPELELESHNPPEDPPRVRRVLPKEIDQRRWNRPLWDNPARERRQKVRKRQRLRKQARERKALR